MNLVLGFLVQVDKIRSVLAGVVVAVVVVGAAVVVVDAAVVGGVPGGAFGSTTQVFIA